MSKKSEIKLAPYWPGLGKCLVMNAGFQAQDLTLMDCQPIHGTARLLLKNPLKSAIYKGFLIVLNLPKRSSHAMPCSVKVGGHRRF